MGYSGLIYAAIVAAWAAYLVPRWIRRNEEIERAREADAARGVRVLARQGGGRLRQPHDTGTVLVRSTEVGGDPVAEPAGGPPARLGADGGAGSGSAARRRRRVLFVLCVALGAVIAAVILDRLPTATVLLPGGVLGVFLVFARRAAVAKAERRARRRAARRRAAAQVVAEQRTAAEGKRIAVLAEPDPAEPPDPNAWEPVPVPLPTYLTKARAPAPVARRIDLSSAGAWTAGQLGTPPPQDRLRPQRVDIPETELPERRRAVGD